MAVDGSPFHKSNFRFILHFKTYLNVLDLNQEKNFTDFYILKTYKKSVTLQAYDYKFIKLNIKNMSMNNLMPAILKFNKNFENNDSR